MLFLTFLSFIFIRNVKKLKITLLFFKQLSNIIYFKISAMMERIFQNKEELYSALMKPVIKKLKKVRKLFGIC